METSLNLSDLDSNVWNHHHQMLKAYWTALKNQTSSVMKIQRQIDNDRCCLLNDNQAKRTHITVKLIKIRNWTTASCVVNQFHTRIMKKAYNTMYAKRSYAKRSTSVKSRIELQKGQFPDVYIEKIRCKYFPPSF